MKARIVTIGDEILIGQVVDTNSSWIGQAITPLGVEIEKVVSCRDERSAILSELDAASRSCELVILTGGLGPTKDDITKKCIADWLGDSFVFSQETFDRIKEIFERFGRPMTEAHRAQCYMPSGAKLLSNSMGTAPGMFFQKDGLFVISVPGVPYEMKAILSEHVIPWIKEKVDTANIYHKTICTAGEGETRIAAQIEDIIERFPAHISIAYLPSMAKVRLRITGKSQDQALLQKEVDQFIHQIQERLGSLVYGYENIKLEEAVGKILLEQKRRIGLAESCTGGYISHLLTIIPGSSGYFMGSIIAYDNVVKTKQLGVEEQLLKAHGAVSPEVTEALLEGLLSRMDIDIALSISGIAGPGGATPVKPVGLIYVSVGDKNEIQTKKLLLGKDRIKNIQYASQVALNMIRKFLLTL